MNEFYYIVRLRIKRKDDKGNEYFGRGVQTFSTAWMNSVP